MRNVWQWISHSKPENMLGIGLSIELGQFLHVGRETVTKSVGVGL